MIAVRVVFFLGVGLALSMAVAWACAWQSPIACANVVDASGRDAGRAARLAAGSVPTDFASTWRGVGVRETRLYVSSVPTDDGTIETDAAAGREALRARLRDSLPPEVPDSDAFMSYREWEGTRRIPPDSDAGFVYVLHRRAGWPILCVEQWWYPWSKARTVFDLSSAPVVATPLPLVPIPLALAWSSSIYGAATWVFVAGVIAIVRFRRRRAGRCQNCGYPLVDPGPCPDCGSQRVPGPTLGMS